MKAEPSHVPGHPQVAVDALALDQVPGGRHRLLGLAVKPARGPRTQAPHQGGQALADVGASMPVVRPGAPAPIVPTSSATTSMPGRAAVRCWRWTAR